VDRLPPLDQVPLAGLDAAFAARLLAAPRADQDRMLAEADLLRATESDDASWRALTVYRALATRLSARNPRDLARAAWTVHESPERDEVQRRLATLVLEHPSEDERIAATCALAACEWQAGDVHVAERRLRALLPAVRERDDTLTLSVLYTLSCLYAWQKREFEALVLARHAVAVAERHPEMHPVHAAHAVSALSDAYKGIDDELGLSATAQRMFAVSTRMAEPDARRLRRQAYIAAHEAALQRGDLLAAREQLEAAVYEHRRDLQMAGYRDGALDIYEARLALRQGDAARAGAVLARRSAVPATHPTLVARWSLLTIEYALLTGASAHALAEAERLLAHLADPEPRRALGAGRRVDTAQRLAELIDRLPEGHAVAALAWREAADAAYDRLGELARAQRELPELASLTSEDHETLARYRSRFLARHRLLIDHLRDRLMGAREQSDLPSWATAAPGGFAAVCAWCRCVRDQDGTWLPLGHFLSTSGPHLTVTHGICDRCRTGVKT
jgi:hypothetical protein